VGSIAINLARFEIWDKDMPVMISAVSASIERDDGGRLSGIWAIE